MTDYPPAVFLVGILSREDRSEQPPLEVLDGQFGRRFEDLPSYPFDFTEFYDDELGTPITRSWYVYESLFNPGNIVIRKQCAMTVEEQFRDETGDRTYNVDVGYVTGSKLVLASRKNYSNRIYMGDGVYTEVTLRYEDGKWRNMPNTYPEFKSSSNKATMSRVRSYWIDRTRNMNEND